MAWKDMYYIVRLQPIARERLYENLSYLRRCDSSGFETLCA